MTEPDYETAKILDFCRRMLLEERDYWIDRKKNDEAPEHLNRIDSCLARIAGEED